MSDLEANLRNFTGTEKYYVHPLYPDFKHTDGVRYLIIEAEALWWIEYIFRNQPEEKLQATPFQVWTLKVNEDRSATIHISDGNENMLHSVEMSYTDFPLKEFTLWFIDGVLILPSEY